MLGIGKSSKVDLIKQVNNRPLFCRIENCDCDREHRISKKRIKKKKRLDNRDESIKQDVNKFMSSLSLKD